jgi:hypothetical protein
MCFENIEQEQDDVSSVQRCPKIRWDGSTCPSWPRTGNDATYIEKTVVYHENACSKCRSQSKVSIKYKPNSRTSANQRNTTQSTL